MARWITGPTAPYPATRFPRSVPDADPALIGRVIGGRTDGRRDRMRPLHAGIHLVWVALALFVAVYTLLPTLTNYARSLLVLHDGYAAAERDRSRADANVRSEVAPTRMLVWREHDGTLYRGVVDEARFAEFVNSVLRDLERSRLETQSLAGVRLQHHVEPVFDALRERVNDFADWYYSWTTGYDLAARAVASAASHLTSTRATTLLEAVEHDVTGYVRRRYRDLVLVPEVSEPAVEQAFDASLTQAHDAYLRTLARQEQRFQEFLRRETTHLERIAPAARVNVALDWRTHAAKMRGADPMPRALDATRGGALATVGALSGATTGAVAAKLLRPFMRRVSFMVANTTAGGVSGGAAGTAAPGIGTVAGMAVGALIGGAMGIAADVAASELEEALERESFEENVRTAIDSTEEEVAAKLTAGINDAVNVWFDDTAQLVARISR